MMRVSQLLCALSLPGVASLNLQTAASRRSLLRHATAFSISAELAKVPLPSMAADEDLIPVYFGCGCFWHVQHEFVEAERRILGRKDSALTSLAGYAGGRAGAKEGKVCYH